MMATEGTVVEKADDVPVKDPSQNQPPSLAGLRNAHPSAADLPKANGTRDDVENKQITDIVDELVNSADASVSGGSDTEASKIRSSDDKGHGRTTSAVNKPKSFKSVSVNKTFLASKGAAAAAASSSRPESATGSASTTPTPGNASSSASKLKLVAKSGTSLGGSTKTLSTNGKSAGAPDGNSVWNKNRPTPVPEPKKLSDEELMSQYGIHMADRLRPEDANKNQSNWADIDDDEEWAPETITWTDGTQITLPHADEMATSPAPSANASLHQPSDVPPKTKSPAPIVAPPAVAPTASVKADAPSSSRKGLVLKGVPEKPQLVAKPPSQPGPAKSPWQTLPPVEKAPVIMEQSQHVHQPGQVQYSSARGSNSIDPYNVRNMPPPPTKEIAADDFSRAPWREAPSSNRELFNSHSGRYEPVVDRRGSRNEGHGRQVLQRPSHGDNQGPAEPSAAFQTHRTSEMPHGRRRTSSNVSGGSGMMAGRLGRPTDVVHPPPQEVLQTRSGSMAGETDSPTSTRTFSPANNQHPTPRGQQSQPWRPSPNQSYATPHHNVPPVEANPTAPAHSIEQDLEMQKKLMREKREMAMKRRMEEEAREEAARTERIRLKLEAMGPAPERKSARKEDIKDDASRLSSARNNAPPPSHVSKPESPAEVPQVESAPKAEISPNSALARDNKSAAEFEQTPPHTTRSDPSLQAPPVHQPQHKGWESSQGSQPLTWSSSSSGRNVWGAPGNHSLGNGTFNSDLAQGLPEPLPSISGMPPRPTPIGPPRVSQETNARVESSKGRLAPIGPPRAREQPQPAANPWRTYNAAEEDRSIAQAKRAEDEAKVKQLAAQGLDLDSMQPTMNDTWKSVRLDDDGRRFRDSVHTSKIYSKHATDPSAVGHWSSSVRPGPLPAPDRSPGDPREITPPEYRSRPVSSGIRDDLHRQAAPGPVGAPVATGPMPQSRGGSRFFPASRDVRLEDAQLSRSLRSKSPTPPPPTMEDHPVYEGNPDKPHVSLPRSPIVVRLPPSAAGASSQAGFATASPGKQAPISFAAAAAAAPSGTTGPNARPPSQGVHRTIPQRPHEIASQEDWQGRINNLFGKKAPMPTRSFNVDSLSRYPIDHGHTSQVSATVSLPSLSSSCSTISDGAPCTTKEMAEECFEEQEMGSLPTVNLPFRTPDILWQKFDVDWSPLQPKYRVQASNTEAPRFYPEIVGNKSIIRVHIPGMPESKTVSAPSSTRSMSNNNRNRSNPSNPRRQGTRGNTRHSSSRANPRGSRDSTNDQGHTDRPSSTRSGRGGLRARSENWTRQASATAS